MIPMCKSIACKNPAGSSNDFCYFCQLNKATPLPIIENTGPVPSLPQTPITPAPPPEPEYTGGATSYYLVGVAAPIRGGVPYVAECGDIIENLEMDFNEGNAFKAIWRLCAARKGKAKAGYKDGVYDAEKVVYAGERMVAVALRKSKAEPQ
jgi:hypothetical protein